MEESQLLCPCFNLSYGEIKTLITRHRVKKFVQVEERSFAGSACGYCIPHISEMIRLVNHPRGSK